MSHGCELVAVLTNRELAVVRGIAADKSYNVIAQDMGIGIESVRTHARRLREKLGMNRSGIAAWAVRTKVV